MATPTSYLQSLSQDDARSFVTSLRKVKDHLSGELEWMRQQVQQKTLQLQGIETLLSEAVSLGLMVNRLESESTSETAIPPMDTVSEDVAEEIVEPDYSAHTTDLNGSAELDDQDTSTLTSPSVSKASSKASPATKAKETQTSKRTAPETQSKPQSATTSKTGVTKSQKTQRTTRTTAKGRTSSGNQELRKLLRPKFSNKTFKEIVIRILEDANKPLHLDEMVQEMYGSLSSADLKRAKGALMNLLWAGKGEGRWQNLGNGMYVATKTTKP